MAIELFSAEKIAGKPTFVETHLKCDYVIIVLDVITRNVSINVKFLACERKRLRMPNGKVAPITSLKWLLCT